MSAGPSFDERGNALPSYMAVLRLHHGPVFYRAMLPNSDGFRFIGIRPDGSTIPGVVVLNDYHRVHFPSNPELGIRDICAWKHCPKPPTRNKES